MRTNEQIKDPSKHIVSIGYHEKGMKMHFSAPKKRNEMCFVHQRITFSGKKMILPRLTESQRNNLVSHGGLFVPGKVPLRRGCSWAVN